MRIFYALVMCLFLLMPGMAGAQEKQPPQENPSTQTETTPSTAEATEATAPHQVVITPEEKARKNPVKFTQDSVDKGKKLFITQCAMCHGNTGDGKGDLATVMHVSPPDFTKPDTLARRTDGEMFAIIDKGSGSMPGEAKRLKENQTWDLVNFLHTLEGQKPAKSTGTQTGAATP